MTLVEHCASKSSYRAFSTRNLIFPRCSLAVKSLLKQEPLVEIVVVNSGGGGMAALLARHGIDVPVIEREEKLYAGAARNIGIRATLAPCIAFLASDCRATRGWARERLAAHRRGHWRSVALWRMAILTTR